MRKVFDNNLLTIFLEGRIDSNNASEIESEMFEALKANPEAIIQVDAEKLEYISSAGLRVLMKLRKQTGKEFSA